MAWWKKVLRVVSVVVPEVTSDRRVNATTSMVTSVFTENSPEEGATKLLMELIEHGAEKEEVRSLALRLHEVIQHYYHADASFQSVTPRFPDHPVE